MAKNSKQTTPAFIEERSVAGLLAGNEQPVQPVGGRYKVNGVWVNANGEVLEDQRDEPLAREESEEDK